MLRFVKKEFDKFRQKRQFLLKKLNALMYDSFLILGFLKTKILLNETRIFIIFILLDIKNLKKNN